MVGLVGMVGSASATAPGTNGLIAFRANTGSGDQIYTIEPNGTDRTRLTSLEGDALQPHWSPDSSLITFEFDPANPVPPDYCNVAYMDADGSNMVVLPEGEGDQCEGSPSFSADGQRIYYEGFDGVSRDAIFSMALDGSDRHLITSCTGGVTDPEASPDGTMLSYTCFTHSGGQALFVSNVDGSGLRRLTPWSLQVGTKADWSPDSRRIMFISTVNDAVNTATIRRDGTGLFWVTHYAPGGTKAYGNSYSPDGNWIVLRLEEGGLYALYEIHPDGSGLRHITGFSKFRPRGMAWGSAS